MGQGLAFSGKITDAVVPVEKLTCNALSSSSLQSQWRFCAARSKMPEKRSKNSISPRKYRCVSARSMSGLQLALR